MNVSLQKGVLEVSSFVQAPHTKAIVAKIAAKTINVLFIIVWLFVLSLMDSYVKVTFLDCKDYPECFFTGLPKSFVVKNAIRAQVKFAINIRMMDKLYV
jgi:hypothetical protein